MNSFLHPVITPFFIQLLFHLVLNSVHFFFKYMNLGGSEWLVQLSVGKDPNLTNLLIQFSESNDILIVKLHRYISFSLFFCVFTMGVCFVVTMGLTYNNLYL